ncbi:MAG TPA: Gfo/Idh/MocA family oxidoreductase [Gaiellaceae bacterium]
MARFRVAVVGCGAISASWFPTLRARPDVEIVAVADPDTSRARAASEGCAVVADVEAAVGEGANLVVNLTPPELHRSVVGRALELGCDVLGEKPMTTSLADAEELIELAASTGRTYAVMQNRRFERGVRTLRDGLAAGRIGRPTFLCADCFVGAHFGGFRDEMPSPLLLDMAVHHFDQARFLTGAEPVAVTCHEFNPAGSWYRGAASAVCTFELDDGSVFSYRGSWCAEGARTSWNGTWRVVGTEGTALWDGDGPPWSERAVRPREPQLLWPAELERWEPTSHADDGHEACIADVLDALTEGRAPETDASDNVRSLAMVFAALESAREGRRIELEELASPSPAR